MPDNTTLREVMAQLDTLPPKPSIFGNTINGEAMQWNSTNMLGYLHEARELLREAAEALPSQPEGVADKGYQVGDFDPQVIASLTDQTPNVSTLNVLETAYMTWPEDIRRKLSIHDLRRMAGWAPSTSVGEWKLDTSAGTPILTYKKCSVIEGEDARYVLSLLLKDASKRGEYNRGWNDCLRAITAQQGEGESK